MSIRTSLETPIEVVLLNAVNTIPFPALVTDGASISAPEINALNPATPGAWRRAGGLGGAHVDAAIFVETSAATSLSAGIGIYGWRADRAKWYLLGQINNGTAIATLGANTGYSTIVETVGVFDRLAIGPLAAANVTPGSGTITVRATPIRQTEDGTL